MIQLLSLQRSLNNLSPTYPMSCRGEPKLSVWPDWGTVPNNPSPTNPLSLLPPSPIFSTSAYYSLCSSAPETDFSEGRRGRLRWWICTAEACLSSSAAWNTWHASGVELGIDKEGHNYELFLLVGGLNLCLVSLLIFTQSFVIHGGTFGQFEFWI